MSVKAVFLPGEEFVKTEPLHQWDYGQKLEITSEELLGVFEVHFASVGAHSAIIYACSAEDGVATVDIPNAYLERAFPITAWVYNVGETSGKTVKTITIPVIQRTKPKEYREVPDNVSDKYTEAVDAMNRLNEYTGKKVENLEKEVADALEEIDGYIERLANGEFVVEEANVANRLKGTLGVGAGGTGATSADEARRNLGAAPLNHSHESTDLPVVPIVKGGTGATTAEDAKTNLGLQLFKTYYDETNNTSEGIEAYAKRRFREIANSTPTKMTGLSVYFNYNGANYWAVGFFNDPYGKFLLMQYGTFGVKVYDCFNDVWNVTNVVHRSEKLSTPIAETPANVKEAGYYNISAVRNDVRYNFGTGYWDGKLSRWPLQRNWNETAQNGEGYVYRLIIDAYGRISISAFFIDSAGNYSSYQDVTAHFDYEVTRFY